ncbi:AAA family ATPase [bacterium]|nr:AAA family ATPase [bacterium]
MFERTLVNPLLKALTQWNKMVLLSGPRQVGKTTLAEELKKKCGQGIYFNWDDINHQKKMLAQPYFFSSENREPQKDFLVIFDEIHKYSRWKNYLKGAFDTYHHDYRFLVTGSGKINVHKKVGDSLLGRYLTYELFPLTVGELLNQLPASSSVATWLENPDSIHPQALVNYEALWNFGGFPDPLTKGEMAYYLRWSDERKQIIVRDELRYLSQIREISQLEILGHLVPQKVGSTFSINSLREDVGVAFETIRAWMSLFHMVYYTFQVLPFTAKLASMIKKEPKIYLYDWAELNDEAKKFENMVALHLFKMVALWNMLGEKKWSLCYLRDKQKREVDFALVQNGKPFVLIEAKISDDNPDPSLLYYQQKLKIPIVVQLVHKPHIFKITRINELKQIIVSAAHFLSVLG